MRLAPVIAATRADRRARRPSAASPRADARDHRGRQAHDGTGAGAAARDGLVADVDHLRGCGVHGAQFLATAEQATRLRRLDRLAAERIGERDRELDELGVRAGDGAVWQQRGCPRVRPGRSRRPRPPSRRRQASRSARRARSSAACPQLPSSPSARRSRLRGVPARPCSASAGRAAEREVHPRRLGEQAVLVERREIGEALERRDARLGRHARGSQRLEDLARLLAVGRQVGRERRHVDRRELGQLGAAPSKSAVTVPSDVCRCRCVVIEIGTSTAARMAPKISSNVRSKTRAAVVPPRVHVHDRRHRPRRRASPPWRSRRPCTAASSRPCGRGVPFSAATIRRGSLTSLRPGHRGLRAVARAMRGRRAPARAPEGPPPGAPARRPASRAPLQERPPGPGCRRGSR